MSKKNERKPKANGKGKKNEKDNKAKKPVAGKTATGNNKSSGAGKTATGKKSSSGQATPPAKRTRGKPNSQKNTKRLSDFRYPKRRPNDKQPLHPVYIFEREEDFFKFLGITHDTNSSNRSKVKPLEHNPNPKEKGKKAYIKKKAEKKKAEDFGPRLKGWKFWSKKDKDTVIEIIEKNNKKRKGG